ncbi:MAG TPA: hypothetical protein VHB21_05030 [Minicystis sp.]|nr:hypothetical protein [Minicystis sp.]
MAAKSWSVRANSGVDELLFQNDTVSLCLLVNRRHATLRVIDFRAGPTAAKRNFVIAAAKRERVEKVFTLVERDEVSTWTRLGFTREGSIPSFYKRSDAWILGAVVANVPPMQGDPRMALSAADDDDDDIEAEAAAPSPALALAERTLQRAKRLVKSSAGKALPRVAIARATDGELKKAIAAADRDGVLLTAFEPFGRDVVRQAHVITARGGFELYASWEAQPCFASAFLEIHATPQTDPERLATIAALRLLEERLLSDGILSVFTLAPADDVPLSSVFLTSGFRRSAVLNKHVVVGGERRDAIVWSKKLAAPVEN